MLPSRVFSGARVVAAVAIGAGVFAVAPPAFASHGGGGVRASGTCTSGSWTLKAKLDDGRVEVEAEVDSNVVGQHWTWVLKDNGTAFAHGTATTVAPSGSFEVRRLTADRSGADRIRLNAHNASGNVCAGTVVLR